jgi:hypothetical protein
MPQGAELEDADAHAHHQGDAAEDPEDLAYLLHGERWCHEREPRFRADRRRAASRSSEIEAD